MPVRRFFTDLCTFVLKTLRIRNIFWQLEESISGRFTNRLIAEKKVLSAVKGSFTNG